MNKFKKILKEPILLFLLLGITLFILYSLSTRFVERRNRQIVVSQSQIAILQESFRKTWNRTPTEKELSAQIDNYIMDEIFFREAVAMGLDKTDPAVKRRLRQIIELMLDDYTTIFPNEAQLRIYLSEHPEKFQEDPRISFRHLYYPFEEKEKAENFLSSLQKDYSLEAKHTESLMMIPAAFNGESQKEISRLFGNRFTDQVFTAEIGKWIGPVESAYGWHLVLINEKIDGLVPDLNEIWDVVEREWAVERKNALKEEQYKIMREQYKISIEGNEG
jgi:hypothetical protein